MHKELEKIRRRSAEIRENYPSQRINYLQEIEKAEADLQKAQEVQQAADNMASYDKATEGVKRAEMALKFAKQGLEKMDAAPRMDTKEYNSACDTCKDIANKAISDYRKKAAELMASLKAAYDEYNATITDVNSTLKDLDNAANVLQSLYPYRIEGRKGAPDIKTPDRHAWKKYALQFDAAKLATEKQPADIYGTTEHVQVVAWKAAGNIARTN